MLLTTIASGEEGSSGDCLKYQIVMLLVHVMVSLVHLMVMVGDGDSEAGCSRTHNRCEPGSANLVTMTMTMTMTMITITTYDDGDEDD